MELTKYGGTEILAHIKHDLRQIPAGKSYGNESVDISLSGKNTSLIDRGKTAAEVNKYRKDFEKQIFKYNRKNLVHAVELVIQCPSDCPPEQHEAFFQTAFDWYCDKYLPAGKDCVFIAEIHRDEHKWVETPEGLKDISKEHLHIAYVPAVPAGEKHPGYEYRLNADALTKRAILREMHPSLQAELDSKGIKATVFQKKSGDGKAVPLSVKQLKEITEKTGVVIDHTLTVDELAQILSKNVELTHTISEQKKDISLLNTMVSERDRSIDTLKAEISSKKSDITVDKEKLELKAKLQEKELENEKLKNAARSFIEKKELELIKANETIATKEQVITSISDQNMKLKEQLHTMEMELKNKNLELQQERQKVTELEAKKSEISQAPKEKTWGADAGWGSSSGWGTNNANKTHTVEEEKLW